MTALALSFMVLALTLAGCKSDPDDDPPPTVTLTPPVLGELPPVPESATVAADEDEAGDILEAFLTSGLRDAIVGVVWDAIEAADGNIVDIHTDTSYQGHWNITNFEYQDTYKITAKGTETETETDTSATETENSERTIVLIADKTLNGVTLKSGSTIKEKYIESYSETLISGDYYKGSLNEQKGFAYGLTVVYDGKAIQIIFSAVAAASGAFDNETWPSTTVTGSLKVYGEGGVILLELTGEDLKDALGMEF
jgi:hypothetical protein